MLGALRVMPALTPADSLPVAGAVVWYDPSDTSTITDAGAGAVSQWDDKSGNARHLTQGTGANRPVTGTATINGLNAIRYTNGSTKALSVTSSFTIATLYAVVVFNNNAQAYSDVVCGQSVSYDWFGAGSGGGGIWFYDGGAFRGATAYSTATTYVFSLLMNGASSNLALNGVNSANFTPSDRTAATSFTVGYVSNATQAFDVGEVAAFPTAHDSTDRDTMHSYLTAKWI